jgi:glycosyltransferase involved in cell wall biosynthesis
VRQAIESVLAQTFRDFELIVVDDGSTDGTLRALAAVSDPRLRIVRAEHRGISATMNTGMRAARGRYVARLDSDDLWLPELLATQVAALTARPDVGAVYARAQRLEDGKPTPHVLGIAPRLPEDSLRSMLHGDFTCNITVVARRECIERAGLYDESFETSEDWDLWLRVARSCSFVFTDRMLAYFRRHSGNITNPRSPRFRAALEARVRVLDKAFADRDLPAEARALESLAYRNIHTDIGLQLLGARDYRGALSAFGRAIRVGPNWLESIARIAWFVVNWEFLSKRAWGRKFVDWQSGIRRQWRERRALRSA